MPEAFICDGMRTPIGRYGGALAKVRTDDLAAVPIKSLMQRHPAVDWFMMMKISPQALAISGAPPPPGSRTFGLS